MSEERPDPDALLRRIAAAEPRSRGRLKVFFGASPGVGKTYAMLEAAQARRAEGLDVVIGWLETHGRAETAVLAEGLERIPPREVEHRGVSLREFDLDAALARRPGLLLLDELAHTNAPGSRHAKRWQDAEELLAAGIDVYTTLNVQHVESLNDPVSQITGIQVRETVPDRCLDEADGIEFVDLPVEELLKRLAEGKVYLPERAAEAVQRFFRRGNLLALRELALRRTAERVDADVRDYRRDHEIAATWPVSERLLVCVRPNPESNRLVRAARRMAARLRCEWIVAWVESPAQPPLGAEERRALGSTLRLAEELGAETVSLSGASVAEALLDFARRRNVSRIVVGKPVHSRLRDRLKGSLLDELVRGSRGIEVMVIPGGRALRRQREAGSRVPLRPWRGHGWAVATVLLSTLICAAMFRRFDNSNLVMVYLLGVAFVAARHGRAPSVLASVLSVACFDFFFVPPHHTFAVADTQYLVTFAIMLVVSLLISTLAVEVKAQAEAAQRRGRRTQILYDLSRELAAVTERGRVAEVTTRHVQDALRGEAELLLPGPDGRIAPGAAEARDAAVVQWAFEHGRAAGHGTDTLPGAARFYLPLKGSSGGLGLLAVRPDDPAMPLAPDQRDLIEALAHQAASALERVRLAREAERARVAAEAERLRSTLLSSVSHDLRTPLAAIAGAASSLLSGATLSAQAEAELKRTILEESERLDRLVGNLLDMTRLESGTLQPRREWESLEEVVGSALSRLGTALDGRDVRVTLPADLPLVPMDPVLIEQVLVNLLENAVKCTPAGTAIEVTAGLDGVASGDGMVAVEVADEGPGLAAGTQERVFEKFYRGANDRQGFGLGLPICRAIVTAHGGRIRAATRQPRGAAFRFTLPLGQPPPPPPADHSERPD